MLAALVRGRGEAMGEEECTALFAGGVLIVFSLDIDNFIVGVVAAKFGFAVFPDDVDTGVVAFLGNVFGTGFANDFPHFSHVHSPFTTRLVMERCAPDD